MDKKTKPVCTECGSDDVRADAYACWNVETQDFELAATFEKGWVCEQCAEECTVEWVELEEQSHD